MMYLDTVAMARSFYTGVLEFVFVPTKAAYKKDVNINIFSWHLYLH